jgi:toxin ParE1/3/4
LIERAFQELREDPQRAGVQRKQALSPGVHLYHLRNTRHGMRAACMRRAPGHSIVFCFSKGDVVILRILHDAMDIPRHIGAASSEE